MPLREVWSGAAAYTHLGFTFAASILVMFFLGYWLDGKLGTTPLLAVAGAFIGATAGFINLVKTLNRRQRESEEREGGGDDLQD